MQSIGSLPKYVKIGLVVVFGIITALFFIINPEEGGVFPECIFYSVTGYYCPGCGSQRAIHSFLHLDILGVINNNLLFLPGGMIIFYGVTLPLVNKKLGTNYRNFLYHKRAPLYIFIVIILFAVFRNLPWFPFTLLVPGT
ncbi:MAG: DUF2752 domain-containing protein [Mariniphaga sp.]|nr:DUF2752 domain-containing protein [Mariniphaga sp.]